MSRCNYSAPPGYRDRLRPGVLTLRQAQEEPFTAVIDQILVDDLRRPRKQRHTAQRIFQRLRDEHGFGGQYTIVKDYVREHRRGSQEMFVSLSHSPGHAQCDFGEALVIIGGVEQKAHCFVLDLPHSDGCFVKAYPAETTEAFLDGHVSAFAFLGGVPQSILYDNTKLAVARILGDGRRKRTRAFTELCCSRECWIVSAGYRRRQAEGGYNHDLAKRGGSAPGSRLVFNALSPHWQGTRGR